MDADLRSIAQARQAVESAHVAFEKFRGTPPEHIDRIVEAMAQAIETEAARLGVMAAEETGYGNAPDKRIKNLFNARGVADWLRNITTLGVLWHDANTRTMAVGEPMGVVAAIIPVTNPTSTIIFKVLSAIKSGNAIVCAPHPRGVNCGRETARVMAEAARNHGAPDGLIQCLDEVTLEGTDALMRHRKTAIIMATGGSAMVRAAHQSGKPTLAVGPGNVPCYVHQSMVDEVADVAEQILISKAFDYGTACAGEQAVIVDRSIAAALRAEIRQGGGYFCSPAEAERLADVIFDESQHIRPGGVGQSAQTLAQRAGFDIPPGTTVLLAAETEVGRHRPLSLEKLNPVLAWYEAATVDHGLDLAGRILDWGGVGHTAVIHSHDASVVSRFARLPSGRVVVNQPALMAAMGYSSDLEPSFMLGTGTGSGSIVSDNVNALHLINIKRVVYESRPWRTIFDVYGEDQT